MTGRRAGPPGLVSSWPEAQLQASVIETARWNGWLAYHTHDSRRSEQGFPDLVLVHPGRGRLLFRELKTAAGRVSPAQSRWLAALSSSGADTGVWRPGDWSSGLIVRELGKGA